MTNLCKIMQIPLQKSVTFSHATLKFPLIPNKLWGSKGDFLRFPTKMSLSHTHQSHPPGLHWKPRLPEPTFARPWPSNFLGKCWGDDHDKVSEISKKKPPSICGSNIFCAKISISSIFVAFVWMFFSCCTFWENAPFWIGIQQLMVFRKICNDSW